MKTVLPTGPNIDHAADITAWLEHHAPLFTDAGVTCSLLAEISLLRDELVTLARMKATCGACDFRPDQLAADTRVLDRLVGRGALSVVGANGVTPHYRLADTDRVTHATSSVTLTAHGLMTGIERDVADIRHARPGDPLFPLAIAVVLAGALRTGRVIDPEFNSRMIDPAFNTHALYRLVTEGLFSTPDFVSSKSNDRVGRVVAPDIARARLAELHSTNHTLYGSNV